MADTLFQYPGGKSGQYDRIRSIMPDHECFVEGFGGSGTITLNKEPSEVSVYNDLDSELVNFFTVYREAGERLCDWLDRVPYSYETYEDFVDAFYGPAGEDPDGRLPGEPVTDHLPESGEITDDQVKRAGVFFTLRYMQFGAKYQGRSGFGRSKVQNGAQTFTNAKERLRDFIGCWDHVTIENVSYEKLIDTYDGEDTLYYFDPPYIGTEGYYRESDFDHQNFCKELERIEGYWIVSYDEIPEELEQYHVTREKSTNFIDSGMKGEGKDTVETLVMNFDPSEETKFVTAEQTGLSDMDSQTPTDEVDTGSLFGGMETEENEDGGEADGWLEDAI